MIKAFVRTALLLAFPCASVQAQVAATEYAARRDSLMTRVGDGVLVAFGAREPAEDYLSFYQNPSFLYLTGVNEPNAALVIIRQGGVTRGTIFVEPSDPAAEVWTGHRMGLAGAQAATGLPARPAEELARVLDSLASASAALHVVGAFGFTQVMEPGPDGLSADQEVAAGIKQRHPSVELRNATPHVRQLRGRKSAAELAHIRTAVDITVRAHREAIQAIEPGMNEFEIQALIEFLFRRNGADRPAFTTIVGSGPNSTTLHYNRNDRFMQAGEVVVMDIGASYHGYAADVTRTVPVSGSFTPAQREIYQLVRDAQAAAEKEATVGGSQAKMSQAAAQTIERGLARLGLIESVGATVEGGEALCGSPGAVCPQWLMYYMHGLGHGIGLDVHDPDQSYGRSSVIALGSAFTIEPGVYVRGNLLDIVPDTPKNRAMKARIGAAVRRYANVGVRIEDDYLITEGGVEWVSRAPREIAEIEALMKGPYAGPPARDAGLVGKYPVRQ